MDERIRKPAAAPDLEGISLAELIHQHVRLAIETAVRQELQAALGATAYEPQRVSAWLPQRHQGADAHGTDRASRAHRPASDPVRGRRRGGMDIGDPAALSTADAGGE